MALINRNPKSGDAVLISTFLSVSAPLCQEIGMATPDCETEKLAEKAEKETETSVCERRG